MTNIDVLDNIIVKQTSLDVIFDHSPITLQRVTHKHVK